jgi:hypothetical protein
VQHPKVAATYPHLSADLIRNLVASKDSSVREEIVLNPNTPIDIIVSLSNDECPEVVSKIPRRNDLPLDLIYQFLISRNEYLIRGLIKSIMRDPIQCKIDIVKRALAVVNDQQKDLLERILDKIPGTRKKGLLPPDYWPST